MRQTLLEVVMNKRILMAFSLLIYSNLTFAIGELSAKVEQCEPGPDKLKIEALPEEIIVSVAKTLIGKGVDAAVNALRKELAVPYETIIPIENVDELYEDGSKCLYVSSSEFDKTKKDSPLPKFLTVIKFQPSNSDPKIIRPIIKYWNYSKFLMEDCSWYRQCSKRDVAFTISLLAPAEKWDRESKNPDSTDPVSIAFINTNSDEIKIKHNTSLPWVSINDSLKGPINLRVQLIETLKPYAFSLALADALSAQKDTIVKSAEDELRGISDTVEAEAKKQKITTAVVAFDDYSKAWQKAKTTADSYKDATDPNMKRQLLLTFQTDYKQVELTYIIAKAAYENADLNWPNGGLGTVTLD
jgi:hypothetical protein